MRHHRNRRLTIASGSRISRIACEALEGRRLLSGDFPTAYFGSGDTDTYTVRLMAGDATQIQVVEELGGGATTTYSGAIAGVASLSIDPGSEYDTLIIDETNGPVALTNGIDYSGYELDWNAGGGADLVQTTNSSITVGASVVQFASTEEFILNGGGGSDHFVVPRTALPTSWTINGGDDNDQLDLGGGNLDNVLGHVHFSGGAGTDTLHVDDASTSFSEQYDVYATQITRTFQFAGVTYASAEGVVLDCEGGGNDISLHSTAASTPVTINGGGGIDQLLVSGAPSSAILFNGGLNPAEQDSLVVSAGTYTFNADALNGTAHLNVTANGAGSLVFNATQHLKSLSISNATATVSTHGSHVLVTQTLTIDAGRLDLRDNDLIVQNGGVGGWDGTSYTGVLGAIQSGRNGGAWTGNGIVTTMPAAQTALTTLGAASASQVLGIGAAQSGLWNGELVTGDSALVKYTYAGDADLNGRIDADDYFIVDRDYNKSGSVFGYANGDFNYNGPINGDDYFVIDNNYTPSQTDGALGPVLMPSSMLFPSSDPEADRAVEALFE